MTCDEALRTQIAAAIEQHQVHSHRRDGLTRAAVALLVIDEAHGADIDDLPAHVAWSNRAAMLLTRRSSRLANHPGQWALPGGRVDSGESEEETALRELREEVGADIDPQCVLGRLDDFATRSGFLITPVVCWGGPHLRFTPNRGEVESIHRIPLTEFLRQDAPVLESIAESDRPVLRMPVGSDTIAAPTAAILYQFREVALLGRTTRVAHFEQPLFAWK